MEILTVILSIIIFIVLIGLIVFCAIQQKTINSIKSSFQKQIVASDANFNTLINKNTDAISKINHIDTSKHTFKINMNYLYQASDVIDNMELLDQAVYKVYENDKYVVFNISLIFDNRNQTKRYVALKNIEYDGHTYKIPDSQIYTMSPANVNLLRLDANNTSSSITKTNQYCYLGNMFDMTDACYGVGFGNALIFVKTKHLEEDYYVLTSSGALMFNPNVWQLSINNLIMMK